MRRWDRDISLHLNVRVISSALLPPCRIRADSFQPVSWVFATAPTVDGGAVPPDSHVQFDAIPLVRGLRRTGWGNPGVP